MTLVIANYSTLWFLFPLWIRVTSDGQFECGEHGRFEYCIDEIPGCVIGCHCHPGYYFDTDTKICEPNIKLTQNRRKYYNIEPTESEISLKTFEITEGTTVTTVDPVDNQIDEITKNADDLSDWLYNKFFKTIENQVLNNTKEDDVLTRRSGGALKKISPRSLSRKKKKLKKRRKSSMRRKLLRITENDSVFDSSAESRSDSSDSSSDESETFEIEERKGKRKYDKEHGYKKILWINKKPKPPLPSFIFLPNMDTPFYPPIGLPPPPAMPMYPLVPVPPVPVFACAETSETSTVPSTTETTTTIGSPTKKSTTEFTDVEDITSSNLRIDIAQNEPSISGRAGTYKKRNKASRTKDFERQPQIRLNKRKPQGNRNKLVQQLRQKMDNPAMLRPTYDSGNVNENEVFETSLNEDKMFDESLNNEIQSNPQVIPKAENVDFKYMSELIHRVDLNNTRELPAIEYKDSLEVYKPTKLHKMKNRQLNPPIGTRRTKSDNSYYTNLGKQIASIIRNADAQDQKVDIEIEQTGQKNDNNLFFNDNSPRSFWERSIRSPLKLINSNKNKFDYLKKSNEMLFNIENRVSIMASTAPSLTLQQIENIVNVMEKSQKNIKNKQITSIQSKTFDTNLNFNLWPQENLMTRNTLNKVILKSTPATTIKHKSDINNFRNEPKLQGLSMRNIQRVTAWLTTHRNNQSYNIDTLQKDPKYIRQLIPNKSQTTLSKSTNQSPITEQRRNVPQFPISLLPQNDYYPTLSNYRYTGINKYFQDSHIAQEDDRLPLSVKPLQKLIIKPIDQQPSYFHHEINNFDYFV